MLIIDITKYFIIINGARFDNLAYATRYTLHATPLESSISLYLQVLSSPYIPTPCTFFLIPEKAKCKAIYAIFTFLVDIASQIGRVAALISL